MRLFICTGLALTLLGCGGSSEGGVKGAKGDTPVRYIICGQGETNCFLAARFDDLDGCQRHKDWAEMLCDRESTPGTMVCRKDTGPQISFSYCTL